MSTEDHSGSWLPRSNSVEAATAGNPPVQESRSYDEQVAEKASECVRRLRDKYPYLARLPVSETPGRKVRKELVEEEYSSEYVEVDKETNQGHVVERLERVETVSVAEALFTFLVERQPYDDGIGGRFEDTATGEEFTKEFHDCWTSEYGSRQAAKNAGAQRQLMGGKYPVESDDSARAGEFAEGEWSDDVATAMLTRTGTSIPNGERIPPLDHAVKVTRSWSQGGVYDTVRNICEYDLGLDSDQWGYVRGDDVHGLEGEGTRDNINAGYAHAHDAIYLDLEGTDLRERFETDAEIETVLQNKFHKAVQKHVEACELAEPEAHTKERAVDIRLDLTEPAAYASAYLNLDEDEEMMEQPVEFQLFAMTEWAANRQRIARSKLFTDAAKADFCKQDSDHEHGSQLRYDRSGHGDPDLVCAHCGSSVGIDGDTMTEYRVKDSFDRMGPWARNEYRPGDCARTQPVCETVETDSVVVEGEEAAVGVSVGESTGSAKAREKVREYVETHDTRESAPVIMGKLGISPEYRETVEEEIRGESGTIGPETVTGPVRPESPDPQYQLRSIVMPDGGEEEVRPSGGGAETVELVLPEERLMRETRLKHFEFVGYEMYGGTKQKAYRGPKIVIEDNKDRFSTYSPRAAAKWLVEHGYRKPWHAELALSFCGDDGGEFEEPEVGPPVQCRQKNKGPAE